MNRADLIRIRLAAEATASAAKALLDEEARQEWELNESRATWAIPEGPVVSAHISQQTLEVVDEQAFLSWLRNECPNEVVQIFAVRNPQWLKQWRDARAELVAAGKHDAPPGTKLDEGGRYLNVATTSVAPLRTKLAALAVLALQQGALPELPALWSTAARMIIEENREADDGQ
jgi:hypothetical protein